MMRLAILLLLAAATASCGDDIDTPTAPTAATPTTILFSGLLQPGTSRFYSFTMTNAGTVTAMLGSIEQAGGAPVAGRLELGLGTPAGNGCAVTSSQITPAALVPQIAQDTPAGTHCVRVLDVDGLRSAVTFTVRVLRP
jgi:hypothetical protein